MNNNECQRGAFRKLSRLNFHFLKKILKIASLFSPCCMGLPVIASDVCGAAPVFITDGYNGFTFKSNDINDLKEKMIKIMDLDDKGLINFGLNSHKKVKILNPELVPSSFISALNKVVV